MILKSLTSEERETILLHMLGRTTYVNGCWELGGRRVGDLYGVTYYKGYPIRAHRAAYEFLVEPIKTGYQVQHKCDNPPCWRPDHLKQGLPTENNRDRLARGGWDFRGLKGFDNPNAKLTDEQVAYIKAEYARAGILPYGLARRLARKFNVTSAAILYTKNHR